MKKIFISILVFFIIIAISLFVFILTFNINRFKPLLIEKLEETINKDAMIGNISLNIFPRLAIQIYGASIKDKNKTWDESLLKAASIEARIKLLPLIKRNIEIEHLYIKGLEINITKGSIPIIPIPIGADKDKKVADNLPPQSTLNFLAKSISITDSSINYRNNLSTPSIDVTIDIIEGLLKNISLYGRIHIDMRLSVFGKGIENMRFKTLLYPQLESKKPYFKNLDFKINLSELDLTSALNALGKTDIAENFIGKEIKGDLFIHSEKLDFDQIKNHKPNLSLALSKGMTNIIPVKDGLQNIEIESIMNKGDLIIRSFRGLVADGNFSIKGTLKDVFSDPYLELDMAFKGLNITKFLPDVALDKPSFEGFLNIALRSSASGLEREKILKTLAANGTIKLDKAKLKNINVLEVSLNKLNMLPGLVASLKSKLPYHYRELLKQNYTAFKPLDTEFSLKDEKIFFQKVVIESDGFYLTGGGYLGLNGMLGVRSNLFIMQDLSAVFIDIVPELKYLQDNQGIITMPLELYGTLPDISIMPDLNYVIQKLAVAKGEELLENIFKKTTPKEDGSATTGSEAEQKSQPQQKTDPAEAIIRSIFDLITMPRDRQKGE